MKAKIQRSMLLVLFVTILIFYGLLTLVMYQKNLTLLKEEVNQEARYIRTAVDISGPAYLKEMDGVDIKTRVTRISTEGKVLYDSGNDAETLENHSKRPEVKEALASGTGEDVRVIRNRWKRDVLLCDPSAGWLCTSRGKDDGQSGSYGKRYTSGDRGTGSCDDDICMDSRALADRTADSSDQ